MHTVQTHTCTYVHIESSLSLKQLDYSTLQHWSTFGRAVSLAPSIFSDGTNKLKLVFEKHRGLLIYTPLTLALYESTTNSETYSMGEEEWP